jgi:hypothetical protein
MSANKFKNPFIIAHILALVLMIPLVIFLTLTYSLLELSAFRTAAMIAFVTVFILSNLLAGLAFRRIGQSPWLALPGFIMGLIPLILYAVLPNKSSSAA